MRLKQRYYTCLSMKLYLLSFSAISKQQLLGSVLLLPLLVVSLLPFSFFSFFFFFFLRSFFASFSLMTFLRSSNAIEFNLQIDLNCKILMFIRMRIYCIKMKIYAIQMAQSVLKVLQKFLSIRNCNSLRILHIFICLVF